MRAAAAARAVSVGGRPKMLREMPRPFYSSHRLGGSNGYGPYPENTAESMEFLLADGGRVMNYTSTAMTSDGVIVNEHDATVDRTKNGTGAVSSMTLAQYKTLKQMPSQSWGPGFPDNTWGAHAAEEIVAQLGARGIHKPEAFSTTGTAATTAAFYTSRGLQDFVQLDTANVTNAAVFRAAGLSTSYIVPDGTSVATLQSTWPAANGPAQINYYQASPPGGTIDAYIQALITAGYAVQIQSMTRKSDIAAAIASAAAAGGIIDGIISNDPIYHDTRIWKARTADSVSTLGRMGHGFVAGGGGNVPRCGFYAANRFGWGNDQTASGIWFLLGELSPLNRPFTLTFECVVESISSSGSTAMSGALCVVDNAYGQSGASRRDGYYWSINQSTGTMTVFKNTGAGTTQATLSSHASALPVAPLKLTADLTSGAAVTSLPVRAVPVAIPSGTQFLLPTGQKAISSGVTAINATSVTVTSVTPTSTVTSGTRIPQTIPMTLQGTSTQVILKRLDTNDTVTAADTTYMTGLFPFFGKNVSVGTTTFTDGVTTAGSPVVTSATFAFSINTDEDKLLTHANIPAGARILSVDSATQVTLTANATASGSGLTITSYRPNAGVTYRNITSGP